MPSKETGGYRQACRAVRSRIRARKRIIREARHRKLEQSTSVQLKIRNYTTQLLANELLVSLRKGYMKDEPALAALYQKNSEAYAEPRVRQILIRMQGSPVALRKGRPDLSAEQARVNMKAN